MPQKVSSERVIKSIQNVYYLFFFNRPQVLYPCLCVKGSDDGLFVRCENTNLATLAVALQNLASLDMPVEELTIYKGHFGRKISFDYIGLLCNHLFL